VNVTKLRTLLGDHAVTRALKDGIVRGRQVEFDFADVKVPNTAFKRVVRDLEFDVAELAIVTFLMARAHGKPLALLPAVLFGRFQHPYLLYNAERGELAPRDLEGRRVGIRSSSVTTVAWLRGILNDDYGVDLGRVRWVTFEDAHVAEYRDPPGVERAPAGSSALDMLLAGTLDAAVIPGPMPADSRLRTVIPDPAAAAADWRRRKGALQINHMLVVKQSLLAARPDVVREFFNLYVRSRAHAEQQAGRPLEDSPCGLEANRRNLEVAIDYVHRQGLIPERCTVDSLFDDVTRRLA
jgi:4,5-dihydroxyphthalate decarboxylase